MATIKTKAQLYADAVALPNPITRTALVAHLDNIVASYENIIQEYTTVQRDALTPFEGQKIYNTTSNRLEYYSASMWLPCSQKETVAVDCSANPNYPEALVGDQYIVTVAGIIGGGSGKTVSVGDLVYCVAPNAGGNEASVGSSWKVCKGGELLIRDLAISFETGFQGAYTLRFPQAVTVIGVEATVTSNLSASDAGEITFYNDSTVAMVGDNLVSGVLTLPLSSLRGATFPSTVTANGVIAAGTRMQLSVSKSTVGGTCNVQVFYKLN